MYLNKNNAYGIEIKGGDYEIILATKKTNSQTKIIHEIKVKCKARDLQKEK